MGDGEKTTLDLAALKRSVDGNDEPAPKKAAPEGFTPRQITISVTYTDPTGEVHRDALIAEILDGDSRQKVGRMVTVLTGGAPWEALPAAIRDMAYMLSWVTYAIKEPPKWLFRWLSEDVALLGRIFEEVSQHDERYFRGDDAEGGEAAPQSRIQVTSPFTAGPAEE